MSFESIHTQYLLDGARLTEMASITPELLREKGWDGLMVWNPYLMGSSKFDDLAIVAAFLKCNLDLTAAAKMVGYKYHTSTVNWISIRIRRHSSKNIMELARMLMEADLLPKDCSRMLHTKRHQVSSAASMIAIEMIEGAITKWGSKEKACQKLHITHTTMVFWLKKKK
jgi:hypothetical protein